MERKTQGDKAEGSKQETGGDWQRSRKEKKKKNREREDRE